MAEKVSRMPMDNGIQTKCDTCGDEEENTASIQTKPSIQRTELEEEEALQTKPLIQKEEAEEEEDNFQTKSFLQKMEDELASGETSPNEEEELQTKPLMMKTENGRSIATPELSQKLNNAKGKGSSLPDSTNSFMSQAFEHDFSNVRVHTDSNAIQMNKGLNARAFTHGSDIYFNSGEYNPGSSEGKQLLAHELTHVVQQNPGVQTKYKQSLIQKKEQSATFAPDTNGRPKGSKVHKRLLPEFVEEKANSSLFVEVKVPGANKADVDTGKWGVVDFYSGIKDGKDKTIGLNFGAQGIPEYLGKDKKLGYGGGKYNHKGSSAPRGWANSEEVVKIPLAPSSIKLGDLKPGHSAEETLDIGQLGNYSSGIKNTAKTLNNYIINNPNPTKVDGRSWNPNVVPFSQSDIVVPKSLQYGNSSKIWHEKLAVYEGGRSKPIIPSNISGISGYLVSYFSKSGIWAYEWLPDKAPPSSAKKNVFNNIYDRMIRKVIPPLKSSNRIEIKTKRLPAIKQSPRKRIQQKKKPFNLQKWKDIWFLPWQKKAVALLGDEKKVKGISIAAAMQHAKARTKASGLKIPKKVAKNVSIFEEVKSWSKNGATFGRLRAVFGRFFLKVTEIFEKIKAKFRDFAGKGKQKSKLNFGSGNIGKVVKLTFGIMKVFLAKTARSVITTLKFQLVNNAKTLLKTLFEDKFLSKFRESVAPLEEKITGVENSVKEALANFKSKFEDQFESVIEIFKVVEKIESGLKTVGNVIKIVKWGIRLFHCATPPILGCLKLALSFLTEKAISTVLGTCWFQGKVIVPLINKTSFFSNLPQTISNKILGAAKDILPLPEEYANILFAPVKVPSRSFTRGDLPCDNKMTKAQRALAKVFDKYPDKADLIREFMVTRNPEDGARITMDMVKAIEDVAKNVSKEKIAKAVKNKEPFGIGDPKKMTELRHTIESADLTEFAEEVTESTQPVNRKLQKIVKQAISNGTYAKLSFPSRSEAVWRNCAGIDIEDLEKNKAFSMLYFKLTGGFAGDAEVVSAAAGVTVKIIKVLKKKEGIPTELKVKFLRSTILVNGKGRTLAKRIDPSYVNNAVIVSKCGIEKDKGGEAEGK